MASTLLALRRTLRAEQRLRVLQSRLQARRARADTRGWVVKRRERTRRLIALGGLVVKARIDVLVEDDRAAIYGALLGLVQQADGEHRDEVIALWRRKGKRAFEAEAGRRK